MRLLIDGKEQVWTTSTSNVNVQSALASLALDLQASDKLVATALLDGAAYDPDVHGDADVTSFGLIEITTAPKGDVVLDLVQQLADLSETLLEATSELSGLLYMSEVARVTAGMHDWVDGMNATGAGLQQLAALGLRMSPDGAFHESLDQALAQLADAQEAKDMIRMADIMRVEVKDALQLQREHLERWKANLLSGGD